MLMPVYQNFGPGVTDGNPISLDYLPASWITLAIEGLGTFSCTPQVTLDQIFDPSGPNYVTPAAAIWFAPQIPGTLTPIPAQTANAYITFPGPWRATRLLVTANDTGLTFVVAQSTAPRS